MYNNCSCCNKCIKGDLIVKGSEYIDNNLNVKGFSNFESINSKNNYISNILNVSGESNLNKVNINKELIVKKESTFTNIKSEELLTNQIINKKKHHNFGKSYFYDDLFAHGNLTCGENIYSSENLLSGKSQFTHSSSFRGHLNDFNIRPHEVLLILNNLKSKNYDLSITANNNHEEHTIFDLLPDYALKHNKFDKIRPIFTINKEENINNLYGLSDLNIDYEHASFDICNSIHVGLGPSIQILPSIHLFPSYFLTDIQIDNHIKLGGDIIFTNENNKKLSEKIKSIDNKLNYLAKKIGLTQSELNEFMNL